MHHCQAESQHDPLVCVACEALENPLGHKPVITAKHLFTTHRFLSVKATVTAH